MNNQENIRKLEPELRACLERGNVAEFETHGHSMIPLLHDGGDKVCLVKPEGKLRVGDVALCVTDDNRFVLHRVIATQGKGYILRGDNCRNTEFCPDDASVIGVASAFIRRGRSVSISSLSYRFYSSHTQFFLKLWQLFWRAADKVIPLVKK